MHDNATNTLLALIIKYSNRLESKNGFPYLPKLTYEKYHRRWFCCCLWAKESDENIIAKFKVHSQVEFHHGQTTTRTPGQVHVCATVAQADERREKYWETQTTTSNVQCKKAITEFIRQTFRELQSFFEVEYFLCSSSSSSAVLLRLCDWKKVFIYSLTEQAS